ncbi:MAG: hypothetical protein V4527_18235 [Pseudomonadota bacterium]
MSGGSERETQSHGAKIAELVSILKAEALMSMPTSKFFAFEQFIDRVHEREPRLRFGDA